MDDHLKQDAAIENALHSQPMAEMPHSIKSGVMSRIQKDKRPSIFTWKDIVLALGLAVSFRAMFYAFENLPPVLIAKLHIQGLLVYRTLLVDFHWINTALPLILTMLLSLFLPAFIRLITNRG